MRAILGLDILLNGGPKKISIPKRRSKNLDTPKETSRFANHTAWERVKNKKSPKVDRRGCQRSFGPRRQRSAKSLLHHVQPCLAQVQPQVAPVQEASRSFGSKDLFAPSPNHFRAFSYFRPLCQALWFANLNAKVLESPQNNTQPSDKNPATPRGGYSTRGRYRHLLETPFSEPLLRTPCQNPCLL